MKKYYYKIFLLFAFVNTLCAYDLWIEQNQKDWVLRYSHLISHSDNSYQSRNIDFTMNNLKKIFYLKNLNEAIKKREIEIPLVPIRPPDSRLYFVEVITGFWTQTPEGLKNVHPLKIQGTIIDFWESFEYLKQKFVWEEDYSQIFSDAFKIVPLKNSLLKKPGEKLKIQILYQKQPLAYIDEEGLQIKKGNLRFNYKKKDMKL